MIAAIIFAPFVALIIWTAATHYGIDATYWQTVVIVLITKVIAIYLKNDTDVTLEVVNKEGD